MGGKRRVASTRAAGTEVDRAVAGVTPFEPLLTGGHPNSLGRTEEVAATVLAKPGLLVILFDTYKSDDEVVRLRVSSALKRVARGNPQLVVPFIDRLLTEVASIDQASAQWSLAELFRALSGLMSPAQRSKALIVMKRNLEKHPDWIVANHTMQTVSDWVDGKIVDDASLRRWLLGQLARLKKDPRNSVAKRANRLHEHHSTR